MTTLYEQYASLDTEIKSLTTLKDELKAKIIEDLEERGEDSESTPVGKFTITKLKTWTYTDKVSELEEEYKACKAQEENTGDATYTEKPSLRFTGIKL